MIENLNQIFKNIEKIHDETKKKKTRNVKLSLYDALLYQFNYSNIYKTKQQIVSDFNFENEKFTIHRSSMYRKEENITVDFYKKIFIKIKELYEKKYKNKKIYNEVDEILNQNYIDLSKIREKYNIYAIDGTNNNKITEHKLISKLNMCIFDCNGMIPIDMFSSENKKFKNNKNNLSDKNNEVNQFMKFIETNNIKNSIFVGDRAYFKYELFNLLEENKLKYVIRIKNNSKIINDKYFPNKKDKNYKYIVKLKENPSVKIIKYEIENVKQIKNKKNESNKVKIKNNYYLITNLGDKNLLDEEIKKIYNARWNIEVFFKLLKKNFKFSYMKEKNESQNTKLKFISLIMTYITKIIVYQGLEKNYKKIDKNIRKRNREKKEINIKINNSNLISGIYDKLLKKILTGNLDEITLNKYIKTYIIICKNEKGRNYVRKSLLPFSKWYVKMYHNIYEYEKIVNALEMNKIEELNKNLKSKSKRIKVKK